ncbi:MAG: hypothetical protein ABJL98_11505 [Lentilitoribacter sp.]
MNTMPVKKNTQLNEAVEELFASYGTMTVLFEVTARLFRKFHPPDTASVPNLDTFGMSDHMRKDIGLPPKSDSPQRINPVVLHMLTRM